MSEAERGYPIDQFPQIIGIEIELTRVDAKTNLSQN